MGTLNHKARCLFQPHPPLEEEQNYEMFGFSAFIRTHPMPSQLPSPRFQKNEKRTIINQLRNSLKEETHMKENQSRKGA